MTISLNDLHLVNPYEGFVADPNAVDLQGWGVESHIFKQIVEAVKPKLTVEVGTWKGASSVVLAKEAYAANPEAKLVCVDTWLGSPEYWIDKSDPDRYGSLKLHHGYPQVYYTFLNNVVALGLSDIIIPFPATSFIAYEWFKRNAVQPDLIYIDGAHDYEEVSRDIKTWFSVLRPGGIIFGDDYIIEWPGVVRAVKEMRESTPEFEFHATLRAKWIAKKLPSQTC